MRIELRVSFANNNNNILQYLRHIRIIAPHTAAPFKFND